jgi:DNA-binding CsgD family transcriptional regulator
MTNPDRLALDLYAAVLDDQPMEAPLATIAQAVGAHSLLLHVADLAEGERGIQGSSVKTALNMDPAIMAEYGELWVHHSPWLPQVMAHPDQLVELDRLVPPADYARSLLWNELSPRLEAFHCIAVNFRLPGAPGATLGFHRTRSMGGFSGAAVALAGRLLPHLRRALESRLRHRRAGLERVAVGGALHGAPLPMAVLDGAGRLTMANAALERLAAMRDGVELGPAGPVLADRAAQERLATAIAACLRPGSAPAPMLTEFGARLPSGGLPMLVSLLPLQPEGVLIQLLRPGTQPRDPRPLLMEIYGLTTAEARLCSALLAGQAPAEVAEAHGVALTTIRSQVRAVLEKTGSRRMPDLLAMLGRLAG